MTRPKYPKGAIVIMWRTVHGKETGLKIVVEIYFNNSSQTEIGSDWDRPTHVQHARCTDRKLFELTLHLSL